MSKVIARIKGGLGNQLFCYAAARRLALVNNAELVIDHVTGFIRDRTYRRRYALDHFSIPCRKANPSERMWPFERYRRGLAIWRARGLPFEQRQYIKQEGEGFDPRLLSLKFRQTLYLDGLWQSERYFEDADAQIRDDLRMEAPIDDKNLAMSQRIQRCKAVALHVRWFEAPAALQGPVALQSNNLSLDYYTRAIVRIQERVDDAHFFVFSDDPELARKKLSLSKSQATTVLHLWLMTQCRHFIVANSTFSWWGAWLANYSEKIIVAPGPGYLKNKKADGDGSLPKQWIVL